MITQSAATAAISLAQEFDRKGLFLQANPGTPLDCLNTALKFTIVDRDKFQEYTPNPNDVSLMSTGWDTSNASNEHNKSLEELSLDIAKYVRDHLNFAKNKVRPIIQLLVEEVSARIQEIPADVQFSRQIIIDDLPAPMLDAGIAESINEYKDIDYIAISSYISLNGLSAQEIKELIKTNTSVDTAIEEWFSKIGDNFIEQVWNGVFTSTLGATRFEDLTRHSETAKDAALLVYLLCLRLFDNPPEGTNISLSKYNEYISELRNQAALRLIYAYSENTRFNATGLLIKKYDNKSITVVGEVYRKWIENGGTDLILFGNILNTRPATFVSDINEQKTLFTDMALRQNYVLTAAHRNQRFVQYKEILQFSAIKIIGDHFQECYSHLRDDSAIDTNIPEYIEFGKKVPEFIDRIEESNFKNIWKLCQNLVCSCVFYYTDSEKILDGIEKACEINPEIEVREAALLSTISYITDYICDQITVKKL